MADTGRNDDDIAGAEPRRRVPHDANVIQARTPRLMVTGEIDIEDLDADRLTGLEIALSKLCEVAAKFIQRRLPGSTHSENRCRHIAPG